MTSSESLKLRKGATTKIIQNRHILLRTSLFCFTSFSMQLTHTKVAQNNWLAMRDLHQQREHWKTQFREKFFQKAKDMRNQMTKMTRTQETHNAEIRRIGNNNGHLPSLMTDHNNNNSNGENNPITQTSSFSLQDSNIPDTTFFENHEILNCPNNTNEITSSPPLRGIKTLSDFINAQLEEFSHEERLSEKLTKEEHSEVLHYLEQTVLEELRQEGKCQSQCMCVLSVLLFSMKQFSDI